jgi:hypothetical protein
MNTHTVKHTAIYLGVLVIFLHWIVIPILPEILILLLYHYSVGFIPLRQRAAAGSGRYWGTMSDHSRV